jgi:hypothetical protein
MSDCPKCAWGPRDCKCPPKGKPEWAVLRSHIDALERENARLVAELARLKAALEWFADGIYEKPELNGYMIREACQLMEEIARKALEGKE